MEGNIFSRVHGSHLPPRFFSCLIVSQRRDSLLVVRYFFMGYIVKPETIFFRIFSLEFRWKTIVSIVTLCFRGLMMAYSILFICTFKLFFEETFNHFLGG
eukprot:TRINITY_DN20307_c0_g1_i1.p1 TRINITY_DN20307_c0_g1~~TRINITY_DN20307_c0_g1_i1.p1  ORF type:complete len:100 (-),score=11.77 TRINITY_DN20307_c0_g1_i1:108-407(-)